MSNFICKGASLAGFTKEHLLNLIIQNELKFNSNGDTNSYILEEDENGNFSIVYRTSTDDKVRMFINTSGHTTFNGRVLILLDNTASDVDGLTIFNDGMDGGDIFNILLGKENVGGGSGTGDHYGSINWIQEGFADLDNRLVLSTSSINVLEIRKATTGNTTGRVNVIGRLGINNTTPSDDLDIFATSNPSIKLSNSSSTTGSAIRMTSGGDLEIRERDGNAMRFYTNNTEYVRINSSGFVGIGETSPSTDLHITKSGGNNIFRLETDVTTTKQTFANSGGEWYIWTDDTTSMSMGSGNAQNSTLNIHVNTSGYLGIGIDDAQRNLHIHEPTISSASHIILTNDATGSTSSDGFGVICSATGSAELRNRENTDMFFYTNNTIRAEIEAGGDSIFYNNVAVGGNFSPTYDLSVGQTNSGLDLSTDLFIYHSGEDRIRFGNSIINSYSNAGSGVEVMNFRKSNNSTTNNVWLEFFRGANDTTDGTTEGDIRLNGAGNLAFQNPSDIRLKKNIKTYNKGYDKVKKLRIVEYEWKDEDKNKDRGKVVGVIAQELKEVLPKSVSEDEDGYLSVSYTEMIPFLWSCNKTLIDKLEELEKRISILESK